MFRIGILRGVNENHVRIGGKERGLLGQGCSAWRVTEQEGRELSEVMGADISVPFDRLVGMVTSLMPAIIFMGYKLVRTSFFLSSQMIRILLKRESYSVALKQTFIVNFQQDILAITKFLKRLLNYS